jgi:hypothetical protein
MNEQEVEEMMKRVCTQTAAAMRQCATLLEDYQPGLMSWNMLVTQKLQEVREYMYALTGETS